MSKKFLQKNNKNILISQRKEHFQKYFINQNNLNLFHQEKVHHQHFERHLLLEYEASIEGGGVYVDR